MAAPTISELKNIISGSKLNERFRASEAVEEVQLERRDFQFLFASGDMLTFMDTHTYDQIEIEADFVGDRAQFLQDGMKVIMQLHEGRPIGIALPPNVVLEVVEADPVQKGQTAASSYKSATLSNGIRTQVPPFIEAGTKVIVSTDDGLPQARGIIRALSVACPQCHGRRRPSGAARSSATSANSKTCRFPRKDLPIS